MEEKKKKVSFPKKETYSLDEFASINGGDGPPYDSTDLELWTAGSCTKGCTDGAPLCVWPTWGNCTEHTCTADCTQSITCWGTKNNFCTK